MYVSIPNKSEDMQWNERRWKSYPKVQTAKTHPFLLNITLRNLIL